MSSAAKTPKGPTPPPDEILNASVLGVTELAPFLGVPASTVHVWGHRGHRPPPDHTTVNGHPAWRRLTIIKWAARTGRLAKAPWLTEEGAPYIPVGGVKRVRRTRAQIEAAKAATPA